MNTVDPNSNDSVLSKLRAVIFCFVAVSVGMPIAWISLAKFLLVVVGLLFLAANFFGQRTDIVLTKSLAVRMILVTVIAFFASLFWSQTSLDIALTAFVKHSKLISIVLLISLIRTKKEARLGIKFFVAGQSFLLLSSYLLAVGIKVPWTTDPVGANVVFSTYLDQSIMMAATAAVFWHLRSDKIFYLPLSVLLSAAAVVNALVLLDGRTGYVIAIAMLSLAAMWLMPKRYRLPVLLITPIIALAAVYFGSSNTQQRIAAIVHETKAFSQQVETETSSGWRLNAWRRSIQAIQDGPWYGHGVGSWSVTVKQFEGEKAVQVFGASNTSNPHQEYLLWGVELGPLGSVLLATLLLAIAWDARHFNPPIQRALLSMLIAMSIACLFNSSLYDDLIGDYFCVAIGLLLAMGFRSRDSLATTPESR